MTLIVPAARFTELLERVESAIEADQFVELRFAPVPERDTDGGQASGKSSAAPIGDRHPITPVQREMPRMAGASTSPAPPPAARAPIVTPAPRAPWWRSEQAYRRRGAWLEWQRPTPWRRGLAAAAWLYLAGHVAAWVLRSWA